MKKLFRFIKENKVSYVLAAILAPLIYMLFNIFLSNPIHIGSIIIATIIAPIVYTVLKLKDIKGMEEK